MDCGESVQNASDVLHAGASLQVYVDHPGFPIYHDSLGKEELDAQTRITFEEAGMVRGEKEHGVWVLPDITLQSK